MTASSWLRQAERHSPGSPIQEPLRSSFCSLAAAAAISQGWSSPGATLLLHLVVPADAIVAALGSEQIDHPTRRQPGRGGPQGPPVRFEVVNAGSIAKRDSAADRGGAGECFCAGCEAIVTAAEGCGESPTWGTISRELRHGRELPLLSLQLA